MNPANFTVHIQKRGTRTLCGRTVPKARRMVVESVSHYWRAKDISGGYGCFTCSDIQWRLDGKP